MLSIKKLCTSNRLALLTTVLFVVACADRNFVPWRQIPIQMARVAQTESFTQTFLLHSPSIKGIGNSKQEKEKALDERMDNIFNSMIGAKNWQLIKNLYGVSAIRDELINQRIHMDGLFNFNVYLDPADIDYLVMEGSGRYFAIRDETDAILMSGDFHLQPQRHSIASLSEGCLPLDIKLYVSRIPGKTTFFKDVTMRYDLIIDTSNAADKTFSIDYKSDHFAFLDLNNDEKYDPSEELIATLKMDGLHRQAKLFDLRGLLFIRQNYQISPQTKLAAMADGENDRRCIKHIPGSPSQPTISEGG